MVSGTGEVQWPTANALPWSFSSIKIVGDLRVRTSATAEAAITEVSATGIGYTGDASSSPSPRLVDLSAATIKVAGESYAFDPAASVDNVLFPTVFRESR